MSLRTLGIGLCVAVLSGTAIASADEARITVQADQPGPVLSPYLTGACIEDVNHEIYGGLYSQMVFGESFQEPAPVGIQGFTAYGGTWNAEGEELQFVGSPGDKLVSHQAAWADGEVGVEMFLPNRECPNAGLIVRVGAPGLGMDNFEGYEIALSASGQSLILGRHRHNWEPIRTVPCEVPVGVWIPVTVTLHGSVLEVFVQGKSVVRHEDGRQALPAGKVGLRAFHTSGRYRKLWVKTGDQAESLPFVKTPEAAQKVSAPWRLVQSGTARGQVEFDTTRPFLGERSQRLTYQDGLGSLGVENQGLNRWGVNLVAGKPYEGLLWARAEKPTELVVALESKDGQKHYAQTKLSVLAGDWQKLAFTLTPNATDTHGRLAVTLDKPGSVTLGYVSLQPGAWGRFRGLPVRRDVAEALVEQGITVLRYGGSMVNHPEYRWKKMVGPRDRRPPYHGTWYPYSTNGWGIVDFVAFCEAAGFLGIPAFNMDETPQDMADFLEYMNGPATSPWGRKRAEDGHPEPYRLKYLELGNEESVNEIYFRKFQALAEAIWARDPEITLVVGDFCYGEKITDPFHFGGAAGGVTSLAAQQKIVQLAKQHDREVWFDLHVGTEGPTLGHNLDGFFSFQAALEQIADGARFKVLTFEFNAFNHDQRRALGNALAIQAIQRNGRMPIATAANCLQPDGQNDNGWDQGLLFLNPSQVWLQPPGYVTRMIASTYQPRLVPSVVEGGEGQLDVSARRSEDGKILVLQVVNPGPQPQPATIRLDGFLPARPTAAVEELAGPLEARNSAEAPQTIVPKSKAWQHEFTNGQAQRLFPAYSFTVIRFE